MYGLCKIISVGGLAYEKHGALTGVRHVVVEIDMESLTEMANARGNEAMWEDIGISVCGGIMERQRKIISKIESDIESEVRFALEKASCRKDGKCVV